MYNLEYISHSNKNIETLLRKCLDLYPQEIDLSLDRIEELLKKLDNPHLKLSNVIHIAGTNGKGSTATIISQLQAKAGRIVHAYRSPHLLSFNERIYINNKKISDDYFLEILDFVYEKNENNPITFFEILTVVAFLAFSQNTSDLCVIEVGLGGTFDATNIINKKEIAIITPIGLDHKSFLGNSLKSIAREKAGIIKNSSLIICSKQVKSVYKIIEKKINKEKCKSFIYGNDWRIKNKKLYYEDKSINLDNLSLNGEHQYLNAACAVLACKKIDKLFLKNNIITSGLGEIEWLGRLQKIEGKLKKKYKHINIWIDVAHNQLGFKVLKDWILKEKILNKFVIILGVGRNKDINEILIEIKKMQPALLCLVKELNIDGHHPDTVKSLAKKLGINTVISKNLTNSLVLCSAYLKEKNSKELIITGSFGIISAILSLNQDTYL